LPRQKYYIQVMEKVASSAYKIQLIIAYTKNIKGAGIA
jgi:hypothetical protein